MNRASVAHSDSPEARPSDNWSVRRKTPARRLLADRAARWLVSGGGLAIIAGILGILIFILVELVPLAGAVRVSEGARWTLGDARAGAVVCDEHRSHAALLGLDGTIRVRELEGGRLLAQHALLASPAAAIAAVGGTPGRQLLTASTTDGRVVAQPVAWDVSFVGQERQVEARFPDPVILEMDPAGAALRAYAVQVREDGSALAAAQLADGSLALVLREVQQNLFTGESSETRERHTAEAPLPLTHLLLDGERRNLFGGTATGELLWWRLDDGVPGRPGVVSVGETGVSAMSLLIGDRSLVVGRDSGALEIWFVVRAADESLELRRIRGFDTHDAPIRHLAPSLRDKGFLAQDGAGRLGLYYSTSHRVLWSGESPVREASAMFYAPKADGALLAGPGELAGLEIRNPHPEVSLRALFGKVWYEGYSAPAYIWQSTGGTDEFEPKLSLTPLMIGTLKGTLYSLFLAIPLAVLGAMYTSHFTHPTLRRYVKPTVELMAALPSVVLGFLAGLWLAPRIEQILPAMLLMLLVLPTVVLLTGFAWGRLPRALRGRFVGGSETLLYAIVVAAGIWVCLLLSPSFESLVFGGDVRNWLFEATGLRYDQRNAIVVGLAMGFAVIPIIFSIAEDALSNVPQNLVSGSLALGASRWQTLTRVVLPTASPGIFSAIMIGFGRAVGETMIVLMATGNTPLMDWNPFNGFRTLSANIAVEIPEAPHGGTLYRALFLAALLLFIFTFVINTVAEVIRQRLRTRYSQL